MSKDNNKSVLEEAVAELSSILEAADKNAKDKIAKELPEKFNSLLSEEIKKLKKKESVNESAKDNIKEPQSDGKKEDTDDNKESYNKMNEMDMREMSIEEVEEAYESAMDDDIFETVDLGEIEKELDEMEAMQDDVENMQNEGDPSDPYQKLKQLYEMMSGMMAEMDEAKMHEELQGQFSSQMSEMYGEDYKETLGNEKCDELYEIYKSSKQESVQGSVNESEEMVNQETLQENATVEAIKQQLAKLSQFMEQLGAAAASGQQGHGGGMAEGVDNDAIKQTMAQLAQLRKQIELMSQTNANAQQAVQQAKGAMTEEDVAGEEMEVEIDETAGIGKSHALNRTQGNDKLPNADHKKSTQRPAMKESENKKLKALIEENKKLSKQIVEMKNNSSELETTNETYKNVLGKYRTQLKEMAVLNTNIAHVNNLLIKEGNLSIDEKKKIIEKFKNVESLEESENTYKSLLSEMVDEKKEILDEGIEKKLNDSIDASSSKIVSEQVVEKTAYKNAHLNKIKSIMKYDLKR